MPCEISVVIPVRDEVDSLSELHGRLGRVLADLGRPYELLFVDDGSADGSRAALEALVAADPHTGLLGFGRNFGKAAALDAGFQAARGEVVVTIDADLQDLPEELPRLLAGLEGDCDLVSGWKRRRKDPFGKRALSRLFNGVVGRLTGLRLHDINCGYKAYRRETLEGLRLYGDLHRFLPVLVHWRGFRVGEVEVEHAPRRYGRSKYGLERTLRGFFDLFTVLLKTRFSARPMHLFGLAGLLMGGLGTVILGYLSVRWFAGIPIGGRPLFFLGMLLVLVGVQLFSTGLLGELIRHLHPPRGEGSVHRWLPPRDVTLAAPPEGSAGDPAVVEPDPSTLAG